MNQDNTLMEGGNDLLSKIKLAYDKFSASEKKIAEYIVNSEGEFRNLSIHQMAKEIGTSSATISRFCKTLGYDGLAEMKFQLKDEAVAVVQEDMDIHYGDSINIVKQKALLFTQEEMKKCVIQLDNEALEKAVDAIGKADKVMLCGVGTASGLAMTGVGMFMAAGIPAMIVSDSLLQLRTVSMLGKNDVIIAITYDGYSKDTVDSLMVAKKSGVTTILITSKEKTLAMSYADIVLYTPTRNVTNAMSITATSVCQISVLQSLVLGIATKYHDKLQPNANWQMQVSNLKRYEKKQSEIDIERVHI